MASLLDIENALSDKTTRDIICEQWYWNEFLPKIDKDNVKYDYRLVYGEFSEHELMSFQYNYPEHVFEWLLENKILVISSYSEDMGLCSLYEKYGDSPRLYQNANGCYKYRFTDKFFEDYQRNVIKRRSAKLTETFFEWSIISRSLF